MWKSFEKQDNYSSLQAPFIGEQEHDAQSGLKTAQCVRVASGIPISLLINAGIGYKPYSGPNPRNLDE